MKSVFLVKSPLQLLNAIEAKHYFNIRDEDAILIIMGDRYNKPKLVRMTSERSEWGKVVVLTNIRLLYGNPLESRQQGLKIDGSAKSKIFGKSIFNVRRLNRVSDFLGEVEYIFIGFSRDVYMRHFVNSTPHKEVVLLDDGNATIEIAKDRKARLDTSTKMSGYQKLKLFGKKYVQGLKYAEVEMLTFFSVYDLDLGKTDKLVKNNYGYIRKSTSRRANEDDAIYFIGAPLDEAGLISREQHINDLMKVKRYFHDKKIIYVAHHRDKKENLDEIRKVLGFDVVNFDYPVEYQFALVGPAPCTMASFFSSAIENCRLIFGSNMKIISFRIDLEECPIRSEIESIYNYYGRYVSKDNDNFLVVVLDDNGVTC